MDNQFEKLRLERQICFPIYAASRIVTKLYQPLLDEMGITYPQYLVFLVLWEREKCTVSEISNLLLLDSGTLTPLLKRMEINGWLTRKRSNEDERVVQIQLTEKGNALKLKAVSVPECLIDKIRSKEFELEEVLNLKRTLERVVKEFGI